jgi:hypothetical protein
MSHIKTVFRSLLVSMMIFSFNTNAEEAPFRTFETDSLSIKLSGDGTGIIKGVGCYDCDFKIVKITEKSKATNAGVEVNILEARSRAGKSAMVSFNPETQEVQYIRWR